MTRRFNQSQTDAFFNTVFTESQRNSFRENLRPDLHTRDLLLLERVLPGLEPSPRRILDYGCGQGKLLHYLLEKGFDAYGMDRNAGMLKYAQEESPRFKSRILQGSLAELREHEARKYDMVTVMGVLQYVSNDEMRDLLQEVRRVLVEKGTLVCTFQNALFDLYTFNKYTLDFLEHELLEIGRDDSNQAQALDHIGNLLTNPSLPAYSQTRARDNIFVRLSNPLTIMDEMLNHGFTVKARYYYDYFGLPPLVADNNKAVAGTIKSKYEIVNAESWRGTFMANAFLLQCEAS